MIEYLWGDFLFCAREVGLYVNRAQAKGSTEKGNQSSPYVQHESNSDRSRMICQSCGVLSKKPRS